jgi:hypothetical protein
MSCWENKQHRATISLKPGAGLQPDQPYQALFDIKVWDKAE